MFQSQSRPFLGFSSDAPGAIAGEVETDPVIQARLADTQQVAQIAKGDVTAFAAVVEQHSARLYRTAYRLLQDALEAEDAVQDCFTRLWQNAGHWQARGNGLGAWLHRVTVNACLDRLRRFRVVGGSDYLLDIEDPARNPEQCLAVDRMEKALEQALAALPQRYRVALVLRYVEGFPNSSAAQMLELNIKAFESLLGRARKALRERLEDRGVAAEDLELLA